MQLLHTIPQSWKEDISNVRENIHNMVIHDHHIIGKHHIYFLNRLSSKENYRNSVVDQKEEQTPLRLFYQKKFNNSNLDWKKHLLASAYCHKRQQSTCFSV